MAILKTIDTLPTTSQDAIQQFDERYIEATAKGMPPTWASEFGDVIPVTSPSTRFPLSIFPVKFQETRDESGRAKDLGEKDFAVNVSEYDDGAKVKALDLQQKTFAVRKWLDAPQRFLEGEAEHVAVKIAELLNTGSGIGDVCGWDGLALFHDSHLVNPLVPASGTFDNLQATAKSVLDVDNIAAELALMQSQVKNESGVLIGPSKSGYAILTGLALHEPLALYLDRQLIGSGSVSQSNTIGKRVRAAALPQLTDTNDWIIVNLDLMKSMPPWVSTKFDPGPALSRRIFDESSDHFLKFAELMMKIHIWYGFALAFPHAVRLVRGS